MKESEEGEPEQRASNGNELPDASPIRIRICSCLGSRFQSLGRGGICNPGDQNQMKRRQRKPVHIQMDEKASGGVTLSVGFSCTDEAPQKGSLHLGRSVERSLPRDRSIAALRRRFRPDGVAPCLLSGAGKLRPAPDVVQSTKLMTSDTKPLSGKHCQSFA